MPKKKYVEKPFTFAVGKPWYPEDPNSSICIYAYGSEVFHGTMSSAIQFRDYCNAQAAMTKKKKDIDKNPYKIYQLVEIPNSDNVNFTAK